MEPAVDTFLKTVLRSGLLDADQLKAGFQGVAKDQRQDPQEVARHFIRTGILSRFQANKLLAGRAMGLVLGPYRVLAPIGRGAMGVVYLARDTRDQQLVALKILPPKRARTEERLVARFRREMDLCQRVAHPNIARTFEVGVQADVYYIAMEFIPGMDLSTMVRSKGPLDVPLAANLFAQVAAGLHHAHEQSLIHRDLKPSNIRVTPSERAKVLDLGLAVLVGEEQTDREVVGGQGYVVGTMDYIAPEQTLDAFAVDCRADIYALGCSLYHALTGKPPFPGGTSREKIVRQRHEEPALLTERNPDVHPRFAELVHRMMAKDPLKRFVSAEAARLELVAWAPAVVAEPVDEQDDVSFQEAVETLQASEAEDNLEDIPPPQPPALPREAVMVAFVAGGLAVGVFVIMLTAAILLLR